MPSLCEQKLNALNKDELNCHESNVNCEKGNTLPSLEFALFDGGESQDRHYKEHYRKVEDERCILTEKHRVHRNGEGVDSDSNTGNENKVENVCADDVTKRK